MMNSFKKILALALFISVAVCAKEKKETPKVGSPDGAKAATKALDELLRAYENGDTLKIQSQFDPSMIGYQKLIDGIQQENNRCKQMRITLIDTKTQVGPDLAVIQTSWEKRCLQVPSFKPVLDSGQSSFLMHRNTGGWKMTGISGSNPLTPVNLPATLTASTTMLCTAVAGLTGATSEPFTITVNDPYQAKSSSVRVRVTAGSDVETIQLSQVAGQPGVFRISNLLLNNATGVPGNGVVEVLNNRSICTSVQIAYVSNSASTGSQALNATVFFP